jgi:hypothetical protein
MTGFWGALVHCKSGRHERCFAIDGGTNRQWSDVEEKQGENARGPCWEQRNAERTFVSEEWANWVNPRS